ncbi:MAG: hypothetical protein U0802_22465 [Candidatus Binatia bacterium]
MDEIFALVQRQLIRCGRRLIQPGVVLTGGSVVMEGVARLAERIFKLPVRLGTPVGVDSLDETLADLRRRGRSDASARNRSCASPAWARTGGFCSASAGAWWSGSKS